MLNQIEYQEVSYPDITLPELNKDGYMRTPIEEQSFVPDNYE
ncbi:hypothetical protein JCM19235_1399 [Vibrio maritimus]|uniref:Uncharacterized protein n=1 Tax=Vibrio maritimus TaxID=990268 RepID=A0A090SQC6_9VIBR|nr:hypothetical protein JCM19235_1399 [Vibrio maritimus]